MVRSTLMFLLWFLCGAMFHFCFSRSHSKVRCNERDREILLQFKKGVVDPTSQLSSWSSEEDCCKWIGVQCHNITNRVTKLDLRHEYIDFNNTSDWEKLGGKINLCLLQLEFLNYLNLNYNNFTAIHDSVDDRQRYQNLSLRKPSHLRTNISTLVYLDLSNNYYLQIDNLGWLSRIPSLKYLDLSGIDLHRETDWLYSMWTMCPSLSELSLGTCQLSSVSSSLTYVNFTSLKVLDLSFNNIHSQIPNWVANLSDTLSLLDLHGNKFDGQIPDTLLNIQNLKSLLLGSNNLSGTIPDWLGQYKNLQSLDLSRNSFHGSIPPTLGNLSSLIKLDLSLNHLNCSLPKSLGQLSSLEVLSVGGNSLAGVVSESNFAKLSNLKHLDLSSSAFLFHFGTDWIPPFQLEDIILNHCMLGPKFPTWIYTQSSLSSLQISSSGISSIDQDKFWSFASNITDALDISSNSISGNISNLVLGTRSIDLTSNNITGGLPLLTPIVYSFYAGNNSFSGETSTFLCGTVNAKENGLQLLDLSHNHLSGEIPECWMNWKYLLYVNLGSNNLTGKIPHSLGSLSYIHSLRLHRNNFIGDIPLSLQNCEDLELLDLGGNKLSGSIPSWMGQSIGAIQLRSNQFSGNIPPQICQLSSLIILDLADNRLSGSIPKCLYNITSMANANYTYPPTFLGPFIDEYILSLTLLMKGQELEYQRIFEYLRFIDLSRNNLSGGIPRELFSLSALVSLNLSQNHLFGNIPQEIGKMKYLESLDFSRNQLYGEIPQAISGLSFLSYLNLSFNNFTGKIPTGTQLQSFDALSYIGNLELWGAPLNNCTQGMEFVDTKLNAKGKDEFMSWFYLGMGVGFAFGFWGVCAALFFNKACRHAYFKLLDDMKDQLFLKVFFMMNSFH